MRRHDRLAGPYFRKIVCGFLPIIIDIYAFLVRNGGSGLWDYEQESIREFC